MELRALSQSKLPVLRSLILTAQEGKCPICGREISEGDACLDHSHKKRLKGTGRVRGVLCRTCNSFLAKSENNAVRYRIALSDLPKILRSMAQYLEWDHTTWLHPSERPKRPIVTKTSYNNMVKFWRAARGVLPPPAYGTGRLTKRLKKAFDRLYCTPEFYK